MSKPNLLTVTFLLYELERLKSPSAQAKYKRFIPILRDAITAIDYYEEENKGLRAEVKRLKGIYERD
jgi:hypothetical protein